MRSVRDAGALLALVVTLGMAACGTSSRESPAVPAPLERFGAPPVTGGRDGSVFAAHPCDMITMDDLRSLDLLAEGRQRPTVGALECRWAAPDLEDLIAYVVIGRDLLVDTYRTRGVGYFGPTTIEGLPAVRQRPDSVNICTVTTGLASDQGLEVTWVGKGAVAPGNDACDSAEKAVAFVVRKLPPVS